MNDSISNLSQLLREATKPLRELQKRAEADDKLILSEVFERLMDAQSLILNIQAAYQEILKSKENIEKQVKEHEAWEKSESNYESFRFRSGATVMVAKQAEQSAYAKEWYCKHCFDNKKKSQLQPAPQAPWVYRCHACRLLIELGPGDYEPYNTANQ